MSRTLAVDGKSLRGSGKGSDSPVHLVSAVATDLGRVLAQEKVVGKRNEITAMPEWLQALYLKGHRVTIDAMGCQKAIAAQIVAQKGDALLVVKGHPPTLHTAIQKVFANLFGEPPWHAHRERSHGRGVTQFAWTALAEGGQHERLGCLVTQRVLGRKVAEAEWRYYIRSREMTAADLAQRAGSLGA